MICIQKIDSVNRIHDLERDGSRNNENREEKIQEEDFTYMTIQKEECFQQKSSLLSSNGAAQGSGTEKRTEKEEEKGEEGGLEIQGRNFRGVKGEGNNDTTVVEDREEVHTYIHSYTVHLHTRAHAHANTHANIYVYTSILICIYSYLHFTFGVAF